MDVDKFVEEFFHWTVGAGKPICGMVVWLSKFRELPADKQTEIMSRIKQRVQYKQSCNLVSGRPPERLTSRGIRPHG